MTSSDLASQILSSLLSSTPYIPPPIPSYIQTLVLSRPPPFPPLPSLVATTRARILASDLTLPSTFDPAWTSTASIPPTALLPTSKAATLQKDVTAQVLDVCDLAAGAWDEVQRLESAARGETRRGREIIRVAVGPDADSGNDSGSTGEPQRQGNSTHRLTLQDPCGTTFYALEVVRVPQKIGVGTTKIGEKIVFRAGTKVARGVVMMVPETTVFLGGRVEAWDKTWMAARLDRAKGELSARAAGS